ncbi:hypothetical protein [Marinomonas sp. GJ51-6]|uniref:hypothetical protein n=1 Tax=Marinomonas sp. GJ51-6 TaxID=2992802 RepID=UPI0029342644|nr:hypothetical protein [Marinomonas sp. GJ51-6]WOD06332.1 hypothetical protein ONZ50_11425 [Marinomonas sp. GJ51-6]
MRHFFYLALNTLLLTGCVSPQEGTINRTLDSFRGESACYDRETEPYTAVVDTHLHYRPFDGKAIPFDEMNEYLSLTSVRFVNVYGIGQMLPASLVLFRLFQMSGRSSFTNDTK